MVAPRDDATSTATLRFAGAVDVPDRRCRDSRHTYTITTVAFSADCGSRSLHRRRCSMKCGLPLRAATHAAVAARSRCSEGRAQISQYVSVVAPEKGTPLGRGPLYGALYCLAGIGAGFGARAVGGWVSIPIWLVAAVLVGTGVWTALLTGGQLQSDKSGRWVTGRWRGCSGATGGASASSGAGR